MDPRLAARRVEVERDRRRRRQRLLLALAVLSGMVLVALALSRSSLLDVDRVMVEGADRSGADEVLDAAGIETGRAMVSVDRGASVARIEALPWVSEARVARSWPATVRIDVTEREPVAVAGEGPSTVVVDDEGRILGAAGPADAHLPRAGPAPIEGPGGLLAPPRRPVASLLAELPPSLHAEVAEGTVTGDGALAVVLHDGILVRLGDDSRLGAKADAVSVVLEEAGRSSIETLDVSVQGSAAVTRTEPALTDADPEGA
jgi:cell division protein FtsQ